MLNHSSLVPIHPPLQGHSNFIHSPKKRALRNERERAREREGTSESARERERERAKERARESERARRNERAPAPKITAKRKPQVCLQAYHHPPRPLLLCQVADEEERRAELLSHFTVIAALCLLC
jgi:hypothetical protein